MQFKRDGVVRGVAKYLSVKEMRSNTTMRITPDGIFYLVNNQMVPARDFEKANPYPVIIKCRHEHLDGRQKSML